MNKTWKKFDEVIDLKGLTNDIREVSKSNQSFEEVPHGVYEVKIEKLELIESKKSDPMVSCWMRIVDGGFKNSLIFMNQVITIGFQIHIANEFLRSLDSGIKVEFQNYSQYGQMLMDIHEAIDGEFEYEIKYDQNKKGYNTFEITDVYEV